VGYKIVLVISGIVISLIIRNVKYLHLNESKWIGYSIYNLSFTFIPVLIIQLLDEVSGEIKFVVRAVFIQFIVLSTTFLIFGPKFYFKTRGKDTSQRLKHSSSQISSKSMTKKKDSSKKSSGASSFTDILDNAETPDDFANLLDKKKV